MQYTTILLGLVGLLSLSTATPILPKAVGTPLVSPGQFIASAEPIAPSSIAPATDNNNKDINNDINNGNNNNDINNGNNKSDKNQDNINLARAVPAEDKKLAWIKVDGHWVQINSHCSHDFVKDEYEKRPYINKITREFKNPGTERRSVAKEWLLVDGQWRHVEKKCVHNMGDDLKTMENEEDNKPEAPITRRQITAPAKPFVHLPTVLVPEMKHTDVFQHLAEELAKQYRDAYVFNNYSTANKHNNTKTAGLDIFRSLLPVLEALRHKEHDDNLKHQKILAELVKEMAKLYQEDHHDKSVNGTLVTHQLTVPSGLVPIVNGPLRLW
ncbi:hypothetical protein IAQ61_005286 [Plenodomus lingam]|uniref:Uncharacterized protein n=1 Tax=Leptosphaeria maculans (strain JN3 / isolate v23.1.3 / race Av1-4-5-6-7-8) TaxID=985895 RepID=E5A768_LEPMJ|nr:predicted protein [Plenodomus lingam JN3]KAH9872450.1 hypothetical protein IAQ61_005286 [Plenodomus lingam]CBX99463.1 predicted protein [Plenodomus lingam JN3]